jgi:hypothetical protein
LDIQTCGFCLLQLANVSLAFSDPTTHVTFVIGKGDQTKKFRVRKGDACRHVKAFDAAFNSGFIGGDGRTQICRIEDTSEAAFSLFVQWLYNQKLDLFQLRNNYAHTPTSTEEEIDENRSPVELWVLAEKFSIPRLQNTTIKNILAIRNKSSRVSTSNFHYIYSRTFPGSLLRRFVVAQCAWELDASSMERKKHLYPHEMLIELVMFMGQTMKPKQGLGVVKAGDFYVPV